MLDFGKLTNTIGMLVVGKLSYFCVVSSSIDSDVSYYSGSIPCASLNNLHCGNSFSIIFLIPNYFVNCVYSIFFFFLQLLMSTIGVGKLGNFGLHAPSVGHVALRRCFLLFV